MIRVRHFILLLLGFFLTSCAPVVFLAGAAVGVSSYKYYEGALTVLYQAPFEKTWDASLKAVDQMGFQIEDKEQELTKGIISAKLTDDRRVTINLEYVSSQETKVSIRVGILGDENASNVIKDKIRDLLFK